MNERDMVERLNQAREFEHTVGAFTFRLRMLSRGAVTRIYSRYEGPSAYLDAMAATLAESVLWVRGATTDDLGLSGEAELLPETPAAAREFLAEQTDIANQLARELSERMKARFDAIEGDRKN